MSCDIGDDVLPPTPYDLEFRYLTSSTTPRLTFGQISLPNKVFNVTSNNQGFQYYTEDTSDVRVLLVYDCSVGNNKNLNKEVLVNFYTDKITVLEISSVANCNPEVKVLYEDK